jgi:multidrug resistance efflux pump
VLRKVLAIVVVLLFVGGALVLWSGEQRPRAKVGVQAKSPEYIAAEGRIAVKPDRRALLSAEVAGRVEQIMVDNLSPVKKGQVLAVLYNADLQQRIAETQALERKAEAAYSELANGSRKQDVREAAAEVEKAKADLELARNNEERDRRLFEQGVVARAQLDSTTAALKRAGSVLDAANENYSKLSQGARRETIQAAQAEMMSQKYSLQALQATYNKTLIRSPLDGIVIIRYKNVSEFADVGDPILEVANLDELIVEADVNEMDAGKAANGLKVSITSDAFPGQVFSGQVYEVSAALKRRTTDPEDPAVVVDQKILPVKVRFLQPVPLKLGMKVDLKILL